METIRFNKPYLGDQELNNIIALFEKSRISGDGQFTQACRKFFSEKLGFKHNYLTTSATDALEMASILLDIQPEDEIIVPSYTFSSTPNAFLLRGAKIVFVDCHALHPNMDEDKIEAAITPRTKAIVPVHYSGVACNMDKIMLLAQKYNLAVVEDAAQALDSRYKGKMLGSIGDFGVISFHETKNVTCGEGGLLIIRDEKYAYRAECIREKGTNRSSFFRGEIDKYGWVDVGSSFLPSDILAAILYGQLNQLDFIQNSRKEIWNKYFISLQAIATKGFSLPHIPDYAEVNGHLFYIICPSLNVRSNMIDYLKSHKISAVFHYQPLHSSKYYLEHSDLRPNLPNATRYGECLIRLPLYVGLTNEEQIHIIDKVLEFVQMV